MSSFEYYEDINKWKGKTVYIGSTVYNINSDGKLIPVPFIEYNYKSGKFEKTEAPDRVKKYGNKMPKNGEFTVVHGSPNGKINKFR